MKRFTAAAYGSLVYMLFLGTFLYAIGFVGNVMPKSIDSGVGVLSTRAVLVDLALLALFAVQHSVMARPAFKRRWTRIVPKSVERSTFVLFASAALALLFWFWQPITRPVWQVSSTIAAGALVAASYLGFGIVLISTFLINHFELFGLQQVYMRLRGQEQPQPSFKTPGLYRHVRHPIYVGFLIGFWSTPSMTVGHLLFACATTGYILLGIWFEERDLVGQFGDTYRRYRRQVGMLLPKFPAQLSRVLPSTHSNDRA